MVPRLMHGLRSEVAGWRKNPASHRQSLPVQHGMPTPTQRIAPFPQTAWTRVLTAQDGQAPDARMAREEVCRTYWPPVYSYFRALGCGREDALDLTQELLADFCEGGGGLERVAREIGSLRSYLKTTARHLMVNLHRDASAKKRGGGAFHVPLDELDDIAVPLDPEMADAFYDRSWAWTIFRRAMDQLAAGYAERGKGPLFEVLKAGLISQDALKPYAEIGAEFGVGESQIKLEVHRARKRLGESLRHEVAATLGPEPDAAAVETELRYLLRVLAHGS